MRKFSGFTLLEVLIALVIFAIIGSITSSTLYYAFNTRERVNKHADRLNEIQLSISIIQRDMQQAINRAVRGEKRTLIPAFLGSAFYLEYTRAGIVNPGSVEKRSTLRRIAFLCSDGQLIRRTWTRLDAVNRNLFEDKILLKNLNQCSWLYLNKENKWLKSWPQPNEKNNLRTAESPFPKATQLQMTLEDWGNMELLFIIPEGLYANN